MSNIIKIRNRFLALVLSIVSVIGLIGPANVAHAAENYDGGIGYALAGKTVYSSSSLSSKIGSIYANEGMTILNVGSSYYYVEYSTANGAKKGYISKSSVATDLSNTCVAKVTRSATTYYGHNTGYYYSSGSVSAGELVVILAKNDDWVYVEYNTNSGRKRAYMSYSALSCYNRPGIFPDLWPYNSPKFEVSTKSNFQVYSGPSNQYAKTEYVSSSVNVMTLYSGTIGNVRVDYIEYFPTYPSNMKRSGYIVY